jgi:hypothetical protein
LYAFLFLSLIFPQLSYAQNNYQQGIVVTLKGDTLHGYIDVGGWAVNPSTISFKPTASSKSNKLTVHDIRYFRSDSAFAEYQKYTGPITTDNTDPDRMIIGRDSGIRMDTVFLKVIQKGGNITLYSYTDAIKTRCFISENAHDTPKELIYRTYFNSVESSAGRRTVNENTYKGQLYLLGVKFNVMNKNLQAYIEKSEYSEHDILEVISKINGISADDFEKHHMSKPKKLKLTLALIGFVIIAIIVLKR